MAVSRETLDLAARHDADQAALKRAQVERANAAEGEKKRRVAFDNAQRKRRNEIHVLETKARESGAAVSVLVAAVPEDVRAAADKAELALRTYDQTVTQARQELNAARENLDALKKRGADKATLREAVRFVTSAEATAAEVGFERRRLAAMADLARKTCKAALETVRAGG